MTRTLLSSLRILAPLLLLGGALRGGDVKPYAGLACAAVDDFFVEEVWTKVGAMTCLKCHKDGGDAEDSKFVLRDPKRVEGAALAEVMRHNREAFTATARTKEGEDFRMLLKSVGKLKHEGKDVLTPDSAGYRVLADFVRRVNAPTAAGAVMVEKKNAPPFFDGIVMVEDRRLLRRITLSLAGRLPTNEETAAVAQQGLKALPSLLEGGMKEDLFCARLREGFNDIFLTIGQEDNAETLLSYDHFEKTRNWAEKHDLSHIADEKERQKARYKLYDDYRAAILGEPMKLIEYVVERAFRLFAGIVSDAAGRKDPDSREKYDCRRDLPGPLADKFPDPKYTVRAWRAVVTFLLRQREFLYE